MSKPAAGNYYIVNRETTSDGTSLAMEYNGEDAVLTVSELGSQPTQVWVITNYNDETQAVSPQDATSLQVGKTGDNDLTVLPAGGYVWVIRGEDDIYTVQDGGYTSFWGIKEAAVGQSVVITTGDNSDLQNWKLIAA
ncbi:hypothetical protein EV363DRAFT_656683 [Boletus edulis]|nr:hypothetical protein EV363DRAFT_656683 [Boletus edulis]